MIYTINNLTTKGKVDDVIDTYNRHIGVPFVVGTIGHNEGKPEIKNGDFVGVANSAADMFCLAICPIKA